MTPKQGARSPEAKAAVYRFYDADRQLLYVGLTHDIEKRWAAHERTQPWWLDVAAREFTSYGSRAEAEIVEATALAEEKPKYDRGGIRGDDGGQYDARLALETDRAIQAISEGIQDGTYPRWRLLPTYGTLSARYGIPIVGVTRGLSKMERAGQLIYAWDQYAVANHGDFPHKAVGRYSMVHLMVSKIFGDDAFTLTQASHAIGLTRATVKRRLVKLIDQDRAERLHPAPGTRELRYRICRHPEPALPDRKTSWLAEDVLELGSWIVQQLTIDEASFAGDRERLDLIARDRRIVGACLPPVVTTRSGSEYFGGSSPWGAPILIEMAFFYDSRQGYQVEWLPERVDTGKWIAERKVSR